ncbi:nuclear transport factor 2 family protein [Mucilaginibacter myungsuensis]|uniref:Nuclear transport factor 2 family protein n=1 Tax=Mucilaginibacter myungsuensis TaxID=649104 RepID=A0A929PXP0_9SPHI|nr:nuclear transport factor 2 family protein [Mucilaginibacter myungsuensis]MBE9662600.1 nuclear transport factor 2 family protein [Mucilaginibacter myungsuensis]MDN3598020.1 nuclear transport factor 2 family protein [Mucilaginibacter myungsuensis]
MKTLKTIALGLALLTTVFTANAADKPIERLTKHYAINTYIDAMSRGRLQGFNEVLDPTATFSMLRGTQVCSYNKKDMLKFMKDNQNVEQACTVSTSEVESNDNITVVKVDMKFNGFIRSNYVTVANTGDGWKITNVHSVFK